MSGHLELTGLRRTFSDATAPVLDGVDLDVPAGDCVVLLGPSGAGKSTVLRLVAGLDTPDGGRVVLDGRDLADVPTERRRTAMVFQRPRLFPYLSVLDNVAFPAVVAGARRRTARADAARFLDLVGAGELAARRPGSLSGGQEQRVALARALAARPDVLLLDEPFSALDPSVRSTMHRLLGELRAAVEPTVVLVTHDQQEAAALADTVAVLLDGRIAQHADVAGLYQRPASLAVSRFLGGRNEIAGTMVGDEHVSALGRLEVPAAGGSGIEVPATLVIRHESVRIVPPDDPAADITGVIEHVTPRGARSLAQVRTAAGPLHTDVEPGNRCLPGDSVGLVLPAGQRWVVVAPGNEPDRAHAAPASLPTTPS